MYFCDGNLQKIMVKICLNNLEAEILDGRVRFKQPSAIVNIATCERDLDFYVDISSSAMLFCVHRVIILLPFLSQIKWLKNSYDSEDSMQMEEAVMLHSKY